MGRPREFEEHDVLERTVLVFWKQGFRRTTFADLERETHVHRHSLQKAFGTKQELFLAAIRHYVETRVLPVIEALGRHPDHPLRALQETVAMIQETISADDCMGCLLLNTSAELAQVGPGVEPIIRENMMRVLGAFEDVIRRGLDAGEIRDDVVPSAAASTLFSCIQGLLVTNKVLHRPDYVRKSLEGVLSSLRR